MSFVVVRSLFAGSLILLAPLRVVADLPKLGTNAEAARSEPPAVVLANNLAVVSPSAATQFTPQRGYTGDLTLLTVPPPHLRQAGAKPTGFGPMQAVPAIPRFEMQLPKSQVAEPLLKAVTPQNAEEIRFFPTASPK